ncbi:DUF2000 family protein [Aeromicrobium sp. CF4.19]|uniref:DUF2000 family protein n=1 Tax=Aeromicrobium sp. CF4.19 TaxID=3373082 RepID=UPI003EE59B4D
MAQRFDTKITVVLGDDLLPWQALNVTAFLTSGITAAHPDLVGEPYEDADGTHYLALLGQPVVVLQGSREQLRAAHRKTVDRGYPLAVYTREMFTTGNDEDNRAVVAAAARDDLDLVGIAVHGPRNGVDKVTKGLTMHP